MKVTLELTGKTPLLQHNPTGIDFSGKHKDIDEGSLLGEEALELCKQRAYKTPDGKYGHPAVALKQCILTASVGEKVKLRRATSVKLLLGGALSLDTVAPLLPILNGSDDSQPILRIDKRQVCVQGDKGRRKIRVRPRFDAWRIIIPFELDESLWPKALKQDFIILVARAGKLKGIGCYRPEFGGPFGQFTVREVE